MMIESHVQAVVGLQRSQVSVQQLLHYRDILLLIANQLL